MTESSWYVRDRGRVRGPFSPDQLLQQHRRGQLARFHDISQDRANWVKASSVLDQLVPQSSAPARSAPTLPTMPIQAPAASREAMAAAPQSWAPIADDAALIGDRPISKGSPKFKRSAMIAVPCVLIAAGLGFVIFLNFGNPIDTLPFAPGATSGPGTIHSTLDEGEISRAVGLVVVGIEQKKPDGTHGDIPLSTGSCFAVSEDGSLITNRHVVEFFDQMSNADDIDERKLLFVRLLVGASQDLRTMIEKNLESVAPARRGEIREQKLRLMASGLKYTKFEPRIWVFFIGKNGRPEKKIAKLVHICDESEYDMAILQVDRPKGEASSTHYFRLSSNDKKMKRGEDVVALGFPGVTRNPVSDDEKLEEALRQQLSTRVDSIFKDRDFNYLRNAGQVSLDFTEKTGRRWIQHNADITHGNSGGPLVTSQGLVVGINTRGDQDGSTFQALSVVQLRAIIEEHVKGAVFSDR